MVTPWLLFVTLLYLVSQWLSSLMRRKPVPVAPHADGEPDGPVIHRYITVEKTVTGRTTDVTFHYVESPATERECIVFLHGFMDTWRLWRQQFAHLTGRYRLLAFDLKGAGQSSKNYPRRLFPEVNDPGGDYSLEMQAEELVTALDQLGVRRFTLVTLDLGTIIGDVLAGQYPAWIVRYIRCQQPLIGHFRSSIPQGHILRNPRGAKLLTAILESAPGGLLRILYGRTGWPVLDRSMKRTKLPMSDAALQEAVHEASHPFPRGPRTGRPAVFACVWAGLYQHNQDYMRYLRDNLNAYRNYTFPVLLVQGRHDMAMPPSRFDGSTGMAFKATYQPFWTCAPAVQQIVLSRPFSADGRGLGDGYVPWAGLIPECNRPLDATEFFPNAPHVQLKFVDAGHFVPLEAPETFNSLLEGFLATGVPESFSLEEKPYGRRRRSNCRIEHCRVDDGSVSQAAIAGPASNSAGPKPGR
jgi:pimeloyl-ACP methyl ester carboxylesterase